MRSDLGELVHAGRRYRAVLHRCPATGRPVLVLEEAGTARPWCVAARGVPGIDEDEIVYPLALGIALLQDLVSAGVLHPPVGLVRSRGRPIGCVCALRLPGALRFH